MYVYDQDELEGAWLYAQLWVVLEVEVRWRTTGTARAKVEGGWKVQQSSNEGNGSVYEETAGACGVHRASASRARFGKVEAEITCATRANAT